MRLGAQLSGSDDFSNLWPQPRRTIEPKWNAEAKDRLERLICEMGTGAGSRRLFAQRLALLAARRKKNKSLQQVADSVGASKAHIWDLETGKSKNPSIDLLTKLAKCFGVSISELIGENPAAKDVDPQVIAMYRELKDLSPADRQAIQAMMDHLKSKKPKG
jgi:transcriptional regulator with XRE-family HTH domain